MSSISFNEDNDFRQRQRPSKRSLSTWLVHKKIAPNETIGSLMLLGTSVVIISIAIYLYANIGKSTIADIDQKTIRASWPGNVPLLKPNK